MEFGSNSFFRLPPDNVGKRVKSSKHSHIGYTSGTIDFVIGSHVVGGTTGARAVITDILPDSTTAAGTLAVNYEEDNTIEFVVGENLEVNASTYAVISTIENLYTQNFNLVGTNNHHNGQFVDDKGAAYFRFSEGEQQLDAFGLSRQSSPTLIGDYFFGYDDLPYEFSDETSGTGSCTHVPDESSIRLSVGTANGDRMTRTSNRYHIYQPGFGQTFLSTVVIGDTGKTNVVRRWGIFDGNDGIFFELDGTTLNLVVRSSVTGSPVETKYVESDWNGDKINGAGGLDNISGFNLDVSKLNIYWIDYQWLGAGRVRFGTIDSTGARITIHSVENANSNPYPYMKTGTLPVRFEILNSGATGSTSEMKCTCTSVTTEGNLVPDRKKRTYKRSAGITKTGIGDTETGLISVRSVSTINSIVNRIIAVPELMSLFVKDNPIVLRVYKHSTVTGGTWGTVSTGGSLEGNSTFSSFDTSSARELLTYYYDAGSHNETLPPNFGYQGENVRLNADGSKDEFLITVQCLTAAATSDIDFSWSWIDMG